MKTILTARSRLATALVLACTAAVTGCGGSSAADGKTRVVAAFYPLAFAAEQIGGPGVDVRNVTPASAEPHDIEVSPRDVQAVKDADVVLLMGHGFQPSLERAAGKGDRVVRLLDTPGLERLRNDDPHVWLDPVRYSLLVQRVARALGRPRAAATLRARLKTLDGAYRRGLAHCARDEIVTSHEAFAYLVRRYGLRQVAVTGLSPEAEVKPRDLQRTVEAVRRDGATTVFFETLVSPRVARTVARETGARTAVLNPIEGLTDAQVRRGEDYFSLMQDNLAALRRALGCR